MLDHKEKFIEKTKQYFTSGARNNNLPAIVSQAKFWKLDESEALSEVKNLWGSDFTKIDENSFRKAWQKINVDKTIDDYSKKNSIDLYLEHEKLEEKSSEAQKNIENEVKFINYLSGIKNEKLLKDSLENIKKFSKTSELFSKIYNEDDLVFVSSELNSNDEDDVKDILTFSKNKENLSKYTFYAINPLKDYKEGRKDWNVASFKYILLESDSLEKDLQIKMLFDMIDHGVPIKMITFTGGKSFHALLQINGINDAESYKKYASSIFELGNELKEDLFDSACKNPTRLSRVPFGTRRNDDWDTRNQPLIYFNENLENVDAKEKIEQWVKSIIGDLEDVKEEDSEKIKNDHLLYFLKGSEVVDVWNDGDKYHTLMYINDGEKKNLVDKRWGSETSFYNFIANVIKNKDGFDFSLKELKTLVVDFKNEVKIPFIGRREYKEDYVNTFIPGWIGEVLDDESIPYELNNALKKLLINIFGKDEETREWTLQWMREFMHSFNVITAPVFWSIPGTGKTMLAKAFGSAIGDWFKTPPNMDNITFNSWLNHTIIIFEECSSGSKKDGKALGDLLKDWITEKELTIEEKGRDPRKILSKHCFIFNANISNSLPPVFIEDNDRRYTIIRNDEAVNLREIWTDEDFERWDSGEYQKILMKWIYNLPKNDHINIRTAVNNSYKEEIVELSKSNLEIALEEIVSSYIGWMSCKELLDFIWSNYGIRSTSRANGNILAKLGYKSKVKRIRDYSGTSIIIKGYDFQGSIIE